MPQEPQNTEPGDLVVADEVSEAASLAKNIGQTPLPTLKASLLWLLAFMVLFYGAAIIYLVGYGAVLGFEYAAQGISAPPREAIEVAINQHILSPAGIVGIYLAQFLVLMPMVIIAANFTQQPWRSTLGLRHFSFRSLKYWSVVLLIFLAADYLLNQIIEIDVGDFTRTLSGTRSLPLAVIIVLLAPLLEEFIFRGYLFKAWRHTRMGLSGTLLLTSVIFTSLHAGQYNAAMLCELFVFSMILGLAREKSGSLWVPVIIHAGNNLMSTIVIIYLGII